MLLAGLAEAFNFRKKELTVLEIINKYDYLKEAFQYVIIQNKSNGVPYHNLNHLLVVLKAVYDAMCAEGRGEDFMLKEMLISAIFHDFNHSAGKQTDDKNVLEAKKAVRKFSEEKNVELNFDFIDSVLDATQYPYIIPKDQLNIYQAIIRDADIVQILQYNWIHQSVFGLAQEANMSFEDFIQAQKKFVSHIEFNTEWGQKLKKKYWSQVLKNTEMLEEIFQ